MKRLNSPFLQQFLTYSEIRQTVYSMKRAEDKNSQVSKFVTNLKSQVRFAKQDAEDKTVLQMKARQGIATGKSSLNQSVDEDKKS